MGRQLPRSWTMTRSDQTDWPIMNGPYSQSLPVHRERVAPDHPHARVRCRHCVRRRGGELPQSGWDSSGPIRRRCCPRRWNAVHATWEAGLPGRGVPSLILWATDLLDLFERPEQGRLHVLCFRATDGVKPGMLFATGRTMSREDVGGTTRRLATASVCSPSSRPTTSSPRPDGNLGSAA
jgi:hypothetical protein